MNLEERIKYAKMKNRQMKKLQAWYKRWWGILIIAILAIIISLSIVSGIYIIKKVENIKSNNAINNTKKQEEAIKRAINGYQPYYIGAEKPIITIIEFADFACPFCKKATIIFPIIKRYPDKVRLEFRDYPLHKQSIDMSLAARCAGEQGKFWTMHDKIFANQDLLMKAALQDLPNKLGELAFSIGINKKQYDTCIQEQRYKPNIKQDLDDAEYLQLKGTPTYFINNHRITGYIPANKFEELIDGLLQQYGTN